MAARKASSLVKNSAPGKGLYKKEIAMQISKVGIVSGGAVGYSIAQVCACAGYHTTLSEVNELLLARGLEDIASALAGEVKQGKTTEQARQSAIGNLHGTTNIRDMQDCDLVIEALIEHLELKRDVFVLLDKFCPPHTILTTNTSFLPIMDVAAPTMRADRIMGAHFPNPATSTKTVILKKTIATSKETFEKVKAFVKTLSRKPVLASDELGFLTNSQAVISMLKAIRLLEAGTATREELDRKTNLGLNQHIGPLRLADLVGLDTLYFAAHALKETSPDPAYSSPALLQKLIKDKQLGHKTGRGFYEYT